MSFCSSSTEGLAISRRRLGQMDRSPPQSLFLPAFTVPSGQDPDNMALISLRKLKIIISLRVDSLLILLLDSERPAKGEKLDGRQKPFTHVGDIASKSIFP
jgi:hypothetical protein